MEYTLDEHVRRDADEPPSALPDLIIPSLERMQTRGPTVFAFSVSWSCVLLVLTVCQAAFGGELVMGVLPGFCAALSDVEPPTVFWLRGRIE
ncbi:hypothetical protein ACFO3J_27245 [Streptomyces polygonati]|uniref:Uncharacterized protein n=1 Tax=Streptomyces polygonati TaxID=1617087 RepID=A0ABV8HW51_9ACTN